ncbi:MAG TPA: amidohydrolase family protein [Clostridiaceae bacterium]|nr:amidohydrolase family protein [Clostridiaceae bacterium]
MKKIDVNCLVGNWPFRKIRKITFNDLKSIHEVNNMEYGYVSSLNSIFYNDPFEGDQDLHEIIKGTPYKHVLTVNPELPWFIDDIEEGIKLFDIKGVRIYPGYHGYTLDNQPVERLCRILAEKKLPLFITIRMEDERLNYLFQPRGIDKAELSHFLESHPENTVILLSIRYGEIMNIKDIINSRRNVFVDTSGFKDLLFIIEKLTKVVDHRKILYGSNHPLYCMKSTILLVEKAEVDSSVKEDIFYNNVRNILG